MFVAQHMLSRMSLESYDAIKCCGAGMLHPVAEQSGQSCAESWGKFLADFVAEGVPQRQMAQVLCSRQAVFCKLCNSKVLQTALCMLGASQRLGSQRGSSRAD